MRAVEVRQGEARCRRSIGLSVNHDILSNFHPSELKLHHRAWPTAEHFFQAMKTLNRNWYASIWRARGPGYAKALDRKCPPRPGRELINGDAMLMVLCHKFKNPALADKLMGTGEAKLIECNYWGDRYWGQIVRDGRNQLGTLRMRVRDELTGVKVPCLR